MTMMRLGRSASISIRRRTGAMLATLALAGACNAGSAASTTDAADGASDQASDKGSDQSSDSGASDAGLAGTLCTAGDLKANDKSAVSGQIQLFSSAPPPLPAPAGWQPPQYRQPCITIKAGQTIVFSGDFKSYPLGPSGSDQPNPIPVVNANPPALAGIWLVQVAFPRAGVFGYGCPSYPNAMFGAVRVIP